MNWVETLEAEGWFVTQWRDEPNTRYEEHAHREPEVRVVLTGSMTIVIGDEAHELREGDRFDVEANLTHRALVGPEGCTYLAGAKRP